MSIKEILIWLMEFYQTSIGSYGIAIFLLILTIKLVLFPLTLVSQKSILKTQKIQPKMQEIREKYKNDMEKQSKKIQELYAEHNISMFSPLMSLVPIFLSWPVIIALFGLLQSYFNDMTVGFLWIANLSEVHHIEIALAVALIQVSSMFINTKLMGSGNQQPKSMLYVSFGLAAMIGWFAYTYPAALGIYWFSFSLISIGEQFLIRKVFLRKHV